METSCKKSEWRIKDLLIAATVFSVAVFVLCLLSLLVPYIKENLPQNLISSVILALSLFCGTLFILRKYPIDPKSIGFEKENLSKSLIFGILGGLFLSIPAVININTVSNEAVQHIIPVNNNYLIVALYLFFMIIAVPVIEELFWRAGVFRILSNRLEIFWAAVISSCLFSLCHLPSSLGDFARLLIASFVFVYLYHKTKFIGASIVAHVLYNLIWFISAYYGYMQTTHPGA